MLEITDGMATKLESDDNIAELTQIKTSHS